MKWKSLCVTLIFVVALVLATLAAVGETSGREELKHLASDGGAAPKE